MAEGMLVVSMFLPLTVDDEVKKAKLNAQIESLFTKFVQESPGGETTELNAVGEVIGLAITRQLVQNGKQSGLAVEDNIKATKHLDNQLAHQRKSARKELQRAVKKIKDPVAFSAGVLALMAEYGGKDSREASNEQLVDLKIMGDVAHGFLTSAARKKRPIEFRRIGRGWKIHKDGN